MHEAGIAEWVLRTVLAAVPGGTARVGKITIVAGTFAGVDPSCLELYLSELSKGTIAAGAKLDVIPRPAELVCSRCGARRPMGTVDQVEPTCASCGAANQVQGGHELYVDSVEVD